MFFFFFSVLMLIPHRLPFSALFEFSDDVRHYALIQQEIARHLYPTTLRALYGKTKVRNAVHCTDLPEDGVLEVGTVPHSESKRIVFSDVLLGTPTLLRVCMCLLQLHNTFPPIVSLPMHEYVAQVWPKNKTPLNCVKPGPMTQLRGLGQP